MKKFILLFSIVLFCLSCSKNLTVVETHGKISVKGNQILDKNGKPLS